MLVLFVIFSKIVLTSFAESQIPITEIFYFNETETCPVDKFYCKLNILLKPEDENNHSQEWKKIEKINNESVSNYDRNLVFRGLCLDSIENLESTIGGNSGNGISASISKSYCVKMRNFNELWDWIDLFSILFTILLFTLEIYCTKKTYDYSKQNPDDFHFEKVNKYIRSLSLLNSWRTVANENVKNDDFSRLLSMQGLRNFGTLGVLIVHNYVTTGMSFGSNPEYLEKMWLVPGLSIFLGSFAMVVQIFFIISSWLLAVQLSNTLKKNGEITLRDVGVIILNRCVRLLPAVIMVICIHRSNIVQYLINPVYSGFCTDESERCRANWWANLLFVQNSPSLNGKLCNPGTWYIAADTQLYFLMLILFYISSKLKIPFKYILGVVSTLVITFQFYISLTGDFEPLMRFSLKVIPHGITFQTHEFIWSYASTFSQFGTYAIGFVFGLIYTENKNEIIFNTRMKKLFWISAFVGLPILTSHFYTYKYSRLVEAFKAITFRPLYGLGFAIGILGMATNTGGLIKKFFEWKVFVFTANFTYSIYMFHFGVLFLRSAMGKGMVFHSFQIIVSNLVYDVFVSFLLGAFLFFIIEHPCQQIQKIILPQLKSKKKTSKIKEK